MQDRRTVQAATKPALIVQSASATAGEGRRVAETAALAGRTARTAPDFAPASLQLAPDVPTVGGIETLYPLEFLQHGRAPRLLAVEHDR